MKEILKEIRENGGYIRYDISLEQLARIKEIADYKVIRGMVAKATNYDPSRDETRVIFASIQNSFLKAVSGLNKTQLVSTRDIVTWTGKKGPTKADREIGKNYLKLDELEDLGANVAVVVAHVWRDLRNKTYTMNQFMKVVEASLTK